MRFDDDAEHGYLAEGADKLTPTAQGQALLYYQDEGTALITASNSALLAFPFETIVGESERANLMGVVLTSLRLVPDEVPDLSEPEDPKNPETSGCGCHATKQPLGSLAPWLLLFAFALARRRKRL
tara:strand:+ start:153 stop:530 length:378 start_codon:yes stop_codon:yes gene_type:complete